VKLSNRKFSVRDQAVAVSNEPRLNTSDSFEP
jgi:hypothetical protein